MQHPHFLLILYNVILWNICYFIAYDKTVISRNYKIDRSYSSNSKYKLIFFFFILYSLFTFFGGDVIKDKAFVQGGYIESSFYEFANIEPIYIYFASISHSSLFLYKCFIYIPAILCVYWSLKLSKCDNYLTLLFFISFALVSFGSTRVVLALSILLLGIIIIATKKSLFAKVLGIGLMVISYFFHSSMLIPLLLSILCVIRYKKWMFISLLALFPFMVVGTGFIMNLFENGTFGFAAQAAYKFQDYTQQNEDMTSYGSLLTSIIEIINLIQHIFVIFLCILAYLKGKFNGFYRFVFNLCFFLIYFGLVFKFSDMPAHNIFYSRVFSMSTFLIYIICPFLITHLKNYKKLIRYTAWIGYINANFSYLVMGYYASGL